MEKEKPVRLIDNLGRIVLPLEAREVMDWGEGTPVEIWINASEDEVVIKKHTFNCLFCGAIGDLKAFNKKYICLRCQEEISGL